jgi:catechol 2,3-dioxygenase-like lactoylglutathione lyase family enzyme
MIQSYGLSHIQLTVRDLERSISFYRGVLGMEELCRLGPNAAMLRTPSSHEVFTLNADPDGISDVGKMGGIAHFGFRLREDVDMAVVKDQVARAGGTFLETGKRGKDKKESYLFVRDPDGYEVEFFWMPAE